MSMIVLADKDGVVDSAPKALYRRLGFKEYDSKITYKDFEQALDYLQMEDEDSASPALNGKRIVPLSKLDQFESNRGFFIVNYETYRNRGKRTERSIQSTERVKRWRERQKKLNKNSDVTQCNALKRRNAHTDTDTDTEKNTSNPDGFDEFWKLYPKKEDKKKARQAWKNLTKEKQRKAMKDISTRYQDTNKKFIPLPTTYLHGERWEDEKNEPAEEYGKGAI